MARITMTCERCGASITDDMAHIVDWDKRHDATCPALAQAVSDE
jgi:hypothetical protein